MWLILSFFTAFCNSAQDIISKHLSKRVSPYVTAWAASFFSLPFLAIFFIWERPPLIGPDFWPALLITGTMLSVAIVFFFKAIEASDLSLSIPILSFTPMFLLVTSPLIVGEFPRPWGIVGMVLIVFGCYALFYHPEQENILAPFKRLMKARGSRYMLLVAILYSIGGNIDKIGVRNSSPLMWSISLNAFVSVLLGIMMSVKVKDVEKQVRVNWLLLAAMGFFLAIMMMFQMNALKLAIVPYVIAIKRTSVILTSLWGVWFLKERAGWERALAVALMIMGVFVISFVN
jgi:drug/metabolite transporter (DMT)-like permease